MTKPTVSFIVPCFKLAHFLPECLDSILRQSYTDFEVLIMDDCSPDNTAEVAKSYADPRVRYIRNESNLGHLRNYNRGISLSQGQFVWLISADDYLRQPYVLQRYVDLLDKHPRVGYVFCPGFSVRDGKETAVLGRFSQRLDRDRVFARHVLLKRLLQSNFVLTPSALVRRECYDNAGVFDLAMPWCGDWYLWCLFALYYDVAYLAEPMVCYRDHHDLSMTTKLTGQALDVCAMEEIAVPWKIREQAQRAGLARVADLCLAAVARTYGRTMASERYRSSTLFMNVATFEASLGAHASREAERDYVRALAWMSIGNERYWQGDAAQARTYYHQALRANGLMLTVWVKSLLLAIGKPGDYVRRTILAFR